MQIKRTVLNLTAVLMGITAFKSKKVEANGPVTAMVATAYIKGAKKGKAYADTTNAITLDEQLNSGGNLAFYKALLKGLGTKETPEKIKFLEAWHRGEGGSAKNNPFNTTKDVPGDADTKYNSVGVRNYPDHATGLNATLATLKLAYYKDIVALLMKDDVQAKEIAKCSSLHKWGTGNRVSKVLAAASISPQATAV